MAPNISTRRYTLLNRLIGGEIIFHQKLWMRGALRPKIAANEENEKGE
jgi:hypothetical protein